MKFPLWKRLLSIACALLAAACSFPGTMLRYAPASPDIEGIADRLSPERPVHVVLVHGMCFKDKGWVDEANDSLARALGLELRHLGDGIPIGRYDGLLYEGELAGPGGTVKTFAILWSPAAAPAREKLCYDTTQPTSPPDKTCPPGPNHLADRRAVFNAQLKNEIMDGCLSEAMYAMGAEGIEHVGSTVEKGLEIALNGGQPLAARDARTLGPLAEQSAPLFVVTQSLGSKLFVDAAIRMANRSCEAFANIGTNLRRTVQVFMEANQLPILALAYNPALDIACGGPKALATGDATGLGALVRLREAASPPKGALRPEDYVDLPLKVAAFTDPNDILSYTLVPATSQFPLLKASDIVVVNDWSWLGLVENPMNAHTTYGAKCRVQQVIAHGKAGLATPCPTL